MSYVADAEDAATTLIDIAHVLVWHAAGALMQTTEGDRSHALRMIHEGALAQEAMTHE